MQNAENSSWRSSAAEVRKGLFLSPFNPDWQLAIEMVGHTVPSFQNINFGCNLTLLLEAYNTTGVPGFLSLENCYDGIWDYPAAQNCQLLPPWPRQCSGLQSAWAVNLARTLGEAKSHFGGALRGVFLCDECMCSGIPYGNFSAVAAAVRAMVGPMPLLYANDCSNWWADVGGNHPVPEQLDLFSIDFGYVGRHSSADPLEEQRRTQQYIGWSTQRMGPHQRLLLVPGVCACVCVCARVCVAYPLSHSSSLQG